MGDGGKKLLMPGTQQYRFSLFQQCFPVVFIFNFQAKGAVVALDQVIGKPDKRPGIDQKFQALEHERPPPMGRICSLPDALYKTNREFSPPAGAIG
jgi:hypothetical protein